MPRKATFLAQHPHPFNFSPLHRANELDLQEHLRSHSLILMMLRANIWALRANQKPEFATIPAAECLNCRVKCSHALAT